VIRKKPAPDLIRGGSRLFEWTKLRRRWERLRSFNGPQRQAQQAGALALFTQKAGAHAEQIAPRYQADNLAAAAIEYWNPPDVSLNHAVCQVADEIIRPGGQHIRR